MHRVRIHGTLVTAAAVALSGCGGLLSRWGARPSPTPDTPPRAQLVAPINGGAREESAVRRDATATAAADFDPPPNAVQPDILVVNATVLTSAEVLYGLREQIEQARAAGRDAWLEEQLPRWVLRETQEQVGRILLYQRLAGTRTDEQREPLIRAAEKDLHELTTREFGGSKARLLAHLERFGLTYEQLRAQAERRILVQADMFETMRPKIVVRRDELLREYEQNKAKFVTPETRELWMIEIPFDEQPRRRRGLTFDTGGVSAESRARAEERARAAYAALASRPFDEVAREYSRGPHASDGGNWGPLGEPLLSPYDAASRRIFAMSEGQYTEPIETATGWVIARCGKVSPRVERSFAEAQDDLRKELTNRKFQEVANAEIQKLAAAATYSSFDGFVRETIRRGSAAGWPGR
ncbi:MAG: peptidylprolyl isomerase [Phycisphaerae bacterium]